MLADQTMLNSAGCGGSNARLACAWLRLRQMRSASSATFQLAVGSGWQAVTPLKDCQPFTQRTPCIYALYIQRCSCRWGMWSRKASTQACSRARASAWVEVSGIDIYQLGSSCESDLHVEIFSFHMEIRFLTAANAGRQMHLPYGRPCMFFIVRSRVSITDL